MLVEELGLTEEMKCGRYKLTDVSAEVGPPGVPAMMAQIPWEIASTWTGTFAIIEASTPPTPERWPGGDHAHQSGQFGRDQGLSRSQDTFRTTDPEGDDQVISDDIRRAAGARGCSDSGGQGGS